MMLAGLLDRARADGRGPAFAVKGGVSLELRLKTRARATKDIDLILHHDDDLLAAFEGALMEPVQAGGATTAVAASYEGFTFRRKGEARDLAHGAQRLELGVNYKGGTWTTISVDIARPELDDVAHEPVKALDLSAVGLTGPDEVPCLPLPYQIAQKLHGMTKPMKPGKRNERVKDLVDLVLVAPFVDDYPELRAACVRVFEDRNTHPWPPTPVVPEHWQAEYTQMATELEMDGTDIADAIALVAEFVVRIEGAA